MAKTRVRGIRIDDELWSQASKRAQSERTNVAAVMRALLSIWTARAPGTFVGSAVPSTTIQTSDFDPQNSERPVVIATTDVIELGELGFSHSGGSSEPVVITMPEAVSEQTPAQERRALHARQRRCLHPVTRRIGTGCALCGKDPV